MSWVTRPLAEVADFSLGKMLDQNKNRGELRPYLANVNVRWGKFELDDLREMRFEEHELDKFGVRSGDVLMCEGGEPGRCAIWTDQLPGMMFQKALHRIRPHECLDSRFLYYSFLRKGQLDGFGGLFTGSTIKHLPKEKLAKVEIAFPSLQEQQRIAANLSAYDDLIDNNRRRLDLLEDAARQLYKEWFVRFRFPGHEHVEIIDGVPEGWVRMLVKDAVKRIPAGKLFSQKTVVPTGSVPVLDQGQSGVLGFHDERPSVDASTIDPIIVFANHTCNQRIIHCGFSAIQNVLPYKPSELVPNQIYWLHHATFGLATLNAYKGHWPELMAKELTVPVNPIAVAFADLVRPMHWQMHVLGRQNEELARARDLLLPKLMSGSIGV